MEEHDAEDEEQKETRKPSCWGDTFEERVEAFFPPHLNVNYKNLETVTQSQNRCVTNNKASHQFLVEQALYSFMIR